MLPWLSIVIPSYNRHASLHRCLQSLVQQRNCDPSELEVIVVDDGSDIPLDPVIAEFREQLSLVLLRQNNRGPACARNVGWRAAKGSLVAFVADDYTLPRGYVRVVRDFFDHHPEAQLLTFNVKSEGSRIAVRVQQLYHELVLLSNADVRDPRPEILITYSLPASRAAVFRRALLERLNGFNESFRVGEDGELSARMAKQGIPQYFFRTQYISHWEERDFWGFLSQRRLYARSLYELQKHRAACENEPPPSWPLQRCVRRFLRQWLAWLGLSSQLGGLARFVRLSPGLIMFLGTFYWTLWSCFRNDPDRLRQRVIDRLRSTVCRWVSYSRLAQQGFKGSMGVWSLMTFRVCLGETQARRTYFRGSFVRDSFSPGQSDIDIGLVLPARSASVEESWREMRRVTAQLKLLRVVNPLIRDRFQTIIRESELPFFRRYWFVLNLHEWKAPGGSISLDSSTAAPASLIAHVLGCQLFMWYESLFFELTVTPSTNSSVPRIVRKIARIQRTLEELSQWQHNHASVSPMEFALLHSELTSHSDPEYLSLALQQTWHTVAKAITAISPSCSCLSGNRQSVWEELHGAARSARPQWGQGSRLMEMSCFVFRTSRGYHAVLQEPVQDADVFALMREWSTKWRKLGAPLFLYPRSLFDWFPFIDEFEVISCVPDFSPGLIANPALKLLHRSSYLSSVLRNTVGTPAFLPFASRLMAIGLRLLYFYSTGRVIRNDPATLLRFAASVLELSPGQMTELEQDAPRLFDAAERIFALLLQKIEEQLATANESDNSSFAV